MAVTFDRPRLHEQVLTHMTRMITQEEWPAGTILPSEAELAQQYKVSRTVVRECVRVLASRGMMRVSAGRGIAVASHEDWNVTEPLALLVRSDHASMFQWLEVRIMLETEAVGLAAQRANDEDIDVLRRIMDRLVVHVDDPDRYRELDIEFHVNIARATHNSALLRLFEGVIQPLRDQIEERALTSQTRHLSNQEHVEILLHLTRGDDVEARVAMSAHVGRVADEIREVIETDPRNEDTVNFVSAQKSWVVGERSNERA